ncbi:4Fe-4S binding protein [Sinanaerobacter chloroacetimidivorans]|jgi:Fe-S-cluster-containing hydrogenase component 2|uniref:4Fe-4S binding protein n=1 Tax=Sinanaerobacter chloroacetimidivorans TaxID=2818044 RepID=A0A8J7W434_9FIRM|nr:4Fe-4S binding protein [Sinanaerobacter chloroacetimidivorans]MBR0600494.1 4Fe-4S binding protein [Sinanaerobacter chloroacetimidivorans]
MALENMGFLTLEELKAQTKYPSEERFQKGPVAVIECTHEIPCNPCESSCKLGAISIGEPITNLPCLDEDKCIGCGICVAQCPGLAIVIVDKTYSDTQGTVAFPYEYYPTPEKGQEIEAVDRSGKVVCKGTVIKVQNPKSFDRTPVVTIAVDKDKVEEVRSIKRS